MELHHKLRRDPNWHPNACNICGGMGHQAANCKTGTIPWREVFGDEAFVVRKPVFWTEVLAKRTARDVDHAALAAAAEQFARERCQQLGRRYEEVEAAAEASKAVDVTEMLAAKRREFDPAAGLPQGWSVAYDPKGKPYYWHTQTNKVQWEKPTEQTPIK